MQHNSNVQAVDPGKIEFKFEITFTLDQWKLIRDNLDKKYAYPMCDLAQSITDCVNQVEAVYRPGLKEA